MSWSDPTSNPVQDLHDVMADYIQAAVAHEGHLKDQVCAQAIARQTPGFWGRLIVVNYNDEKTGEHRWGVASVIAYEELTTLPQ